ncbi:MAG: MoaD/ThiS family protein [bacterium]
MKYNVEFFGMTNDAAGVRTVELELDDGASLKDLVGALRRKMPALEGSVIRPGEDRLTAHYAFNVNGRFYVDDYDVVVEGDDHILLLTFALGG